MKVIYFDISQNTFNICRKLNSLGFNLSFTNQSLNKNTVNLCNDFDIVVLLSSNYEFDSFILSRLQEMGVRLIVVTRYTKENIDFNLINNQLKIKVAQVGLFDNELFNLTMFKSMIDSLVPKSNENFLVQQNILNKKIALIGDNETSEFLDETLRKLGFRNIFYCIFNVKNNLGSKKYITWENINNSFDVISVQESYFINPGWINEKWLSTLKSDVCVLNNLTKHLHNWNSVKNYLSLNPKFNYVCNFIDTLPINELQLLKNDARIYNNFFLNLVPQFCNIQNFENFINKLNEVIFIFGTTSRTKAIIDK